jgi:hypothetical protein
MQRNSVFLGLAGAGVLFPVFACFADCEPPTSARIKIVITHSGGSITRYECPGDPITISDVASTWERINIYQDGGTGLDIGRITLDAVSVRARGDYP